VTAELYYRISITAGSATFDLSPHLTNFTIDEDETRPDQLMVEMSDPYKVLSHAIQEGMDVEVDLGTTDDHSIIFRGRIYKSDGSFPQDGVPTLRLTAYDKSMAMGLRRRNRPWTDLSLSELVSEVAGEYFDQNVAVDVLGDPGFTGNGIRQQDETDLAFLLRLADTYGCELYAIADEDGDTLHFEAQYSIMNRDPEIILAYGRCDVAHRLLSFEASSDISQVQLPRVFSGIEYETGELTEVETAAIDDVGDDEDPFVDENWAEYQKRHPSQAAALEGLLSEASDVREDLQVELGEVEREATPGFTTAETLRKRAQNQFSTSLQGMQATATAVGNQRIRAQMNIGISDVGGRFSGHWYVSAARHILDSQGYRTELTCNR